MEEVRGVKSSRRKLKPSRRKLESLELESPLVLGDAGRKRGRGQPPKETVASPKDRKKKQRRKEQALEKEHKMKALEKVNAAKVWDRPGKDYNLADFAQNPETAVLLWHANTGSWRDREPKWLFGYVHLRNKLKAGGDVETLSKLNSIYQESIEDGVSLMRVCRERAKNNWPLIDAWQKEKRINSLEFAALEWLATEDFFVCDNDYELLRKKRKKFIGLQLEVPNRWLEKNGKQRRIILDLKKRRDAEADVHLCEIVDVDYRDKEGRYFKILCNDDGGRYSMGHSEVEKCAPSNDTEKEKLKREFKCIDGKFEDLCRDALKALSDQADDTSIDEMCYNHAIERAEQILNSQRVTPEKQRELGKKFLKSQGRGVSWGKASEFDEEEIKSVDAPLLTCASCGFRPRSVHSKDEDMKLLFKDKDVKSLLWAELDDDKRSKHLAKIGKPPLHLPINDKGGTDDFKNFETWRAYSRWPAEKPDELTKDNTLPEWMFCKNVDGGHDRSKPKYFHLHPEFVQEFTDDNGTKDFKVKLCPRCYEFKPSTKSKAPMRSIASGVDFGSPSRVGLVRLTPRERQMISKVRHYQNAVKIESNTGRQRELSHSAIKGHSILFDHDSPRVIKDLLSAENINDSIDIHFVGPDGQYDHLAKKALGSAHVSARAFAVYQWLSVLGEVNKMYSDDGPLPPFPAVVERIGKCNKALVENALLVATDEKIAKETDVARDDIREVRVVSSGRRESASTLLGNTSDSVDKVSAH